MLRVGISRLFKKTAFLVSSTYFAVFLIVPNVLFADTIYQQLTDNLGSTELAAIVGSFTTDSNEHILGSTGVGALFVAENNSASSWNGQVWISSSTAITASNLDWSSNSMEEVPNDGNAYFVPASGTLTSGSSYTLKPNTTYYVYVTAGVSGIRVRSSQNFVAWYGYLTDSGFNSIPIIPAIPGFTNTGIATSSQARNCATNFSTSTGLIDGIGQSFAVGICNVSTFLFVPDIQVLNSYQQLFSTSSGSGFFARFPASYAVGISNAFASLSASSTGNVALLSFDFPGISTTTPGFGTFIPERIDILSTTTISTYYPDNIRLAMLFLISCGLWLTFATDVFFTVRNRMHRV